MTTPATDQGAPDAPTPSQVDFDLHGFVGVRLVEPTPGDVEMIRRQIGPL